MTKEYFSQSDLKNLGFSLSLETNASTNEEEDVSCDSTSDSDDWSFYRADGTKTSSKVVAEHESTKPESSTNDDPNKAPRQSKQFELDLQDMFSYTGDQQDDVFEQEDNFIPFKILADSSQDNTTTVEDVALMYGEGMGALEDGDDGYSSESSTEGFQPSESIRPMKRRRQRPEAPKRRTSRYDSIEAFKRLGPLQPEVDLLGKKSSSSSSTSSFATTPQITPSTSQQLFDEVFFKRTAPRKSSRDVVTSRRSPIERCVGCVRGLVEGVGGMVKCVEYVQVEHGATLQMLLWAPLFLMVVYIVFVESGQPFHGSFTL